MRELPEKFKEKMRSILGCEADSLFEALDDEAVTGVRLNKRKSGAEFSDGIPVDWCQSGYYLSERPEFIFDPLFHAGAYYVQDPSSMIYETLVENLSKKLLAEFPGAVLRVLDLCAAPGGKTTAMINGLPEGTEVTANEYSPKRVGALRENLVRWGYPKVMVTNRDSAFFAEGGEKYDIIAVDAPCSGEGMMRKDEFAREQWSTELVEKCSALQKDILKNAMKALKSGGFLVFSTCTFNKEENEENATFMVEKLGLEPYDPCFPEEWHISGGINTELPVYRFMPHRTRGEGLFLSVMKKPGEWKPSPYFKMRLKEERKTKTDVPDYEEIMQCGNLLPEIPKLELSLPDAQSYLRREALRTSDEVPKGPVIVTYKGLHLGAAKNVGTRLNNLYPKHLRILKQKNEKNR